MVRLKVAGLQQLRQLVNGTTAKARTNGTTCKFQYHIRKGEYPNISFYHCSGFEFETVEQAKNAAWRECLRRGIDPMRVKMYTIRRNTKKETTK